MTESELQFSQVVGELHETEQEDWSKHFTVEEVGMMYKMFAPNRPPRDVVWKILGFRLMKEKEIGGNMERMWKDGKLNGLQKRWWQNENNEIKILCVETMWKNGKLSGSSYWYDRDGIMFSHVLWEDENKIFEEWFDKNGKKRSKRTWIGNLAWLDEYWDENGEKRPVKTTEIELLNAEDVDAELTNWM